MPIDSRRKGREAEREVEKEIEKRSIEVDRNLGGRLQKYGDIRIPGVAIEVRRRERLNMEAWSRDHERDTPDHLVPAVIYKVNRGRWRVSVPLEDFLDLYESSRL